MKSPDAKYTRLPEEERRRLLIDATIQCLSEHGLGGTTVRKIAERAGVAPNLITHHFSGKETLVSAAYRDLAEKFHRDYVLASDAAGDDAISRFRAFVAAPFKPQTLNADLLRLWISFWTTALTDRNSMAAHVHTETAGHTRTYLKQLLREVIAEKERTADEKEIHDLAIAIGSLTDGLWLTWGLDPSLFEADDGIRITFEILATRMDMPELAEPIAPIDRLKECV